MIVVATAKGFYIGTREPGEVFEIDESILKVVDGKRVLASWMRLAEPAEIGKLETAEAAEARAEGTLSGASKKAKAAEKKAAKGKAVEGSVDDHL